MAGALGIIVGFCVYQYGFLFLTLGLSPSLSSWTLALAPWMGTSQESVALMGAVFQLAGGALAIAGLLSCISWVGLQSKGKQLATQLPRTLEPEILAPVSPRRCKFCQAIMEPDAMFCPQCQRSQV